MYVRIEYVMVLSGNIIDYSNPRKNIGLPHAIAIPNIQITPQNTAIEYYLLSVGYWILNSL